MADDREQYIWQVRASAVLDGLLRAQLKVKDDNERLPVLRWTVQSAGCVLYGEPPGAGDDASKEAAVRAWADRLGIEVRPTPMGDGWTRLTAHGKYERVTVAVSATLYGDEEEGSRGA